jgi:type II secretory pathway pseudopilin PulG
MTLVELLIVIIILGILLTVAVAALFRARVSSNEASAVAGLRAIYSAQFAYTAGCGRGNYATRLTDLTVPPPGGTEGYLSPDLSGSNNPERNGYRFNLRPAAGGMAGLADCHGSPTQTRYYASTVPAALNTTGYRSFAVNQAGAIWQTEGGIAPNEPFGPPAEIIK